MFTQADRNDGSEWQTVERGGQLRHNKKWWTADEES